MPDTLTHLLIAIPIGRWFFQRPWRYIFYLGAVLPDLLSRGLSGLFQNSRDYFVPLHTPTGLIIFAILFASFFERRYFGKTFFYISMGFAFHFIPDALQYHLYGGAYLWFFPFSWRTYYGGFFDPIASLYFLPVLLMSIFFIEMRTFSRAK